MARNAQWWLPFLILTSTGCGDATAHPDDGGVRSDAAVTSDASADAGDIEDVLPSGARVALAMLPAPPVLTPCADGWRALAEDGAPTMCEPWPDTGYATCPTAELHVPGTPGCRAVGDACPVGSFRDDLPMTGVIYVDPSVGAVGDGSRAAPFATIAQATSGVSAGTIIALAAGDFDEPVTLSDGVELRGACASRTHVTLSTRGTPAATITVRGTGVTVRDLSVAGARAGLLVDEAASATIRGVAIEGATETGLRAHHGGAATLDDVVIRGTHVDPGDHVSAFAIAVELGGRVSASAVAMEGCGPAIAIADGAGSMLSLTNAVLADGVATMRNGGLGIAAQHEATISLDHVVVERATLAGLLAAASATIDGTDVLVRDTALGAGGVSQAVEAELAGTIRLSRSRVTRSAHLAATAIRPGSTLELTDTVVDDVSPNATGGGGSGVGATMRGTATLTRVLVRRARNAGIFADTDSTLALTDVAVQDIEPEEATGLLGRGVQLQTGALVVLDRVSVERATGGVHSVAAGSVTGNDLTVRDLRAETGGALDAAGVALNVQQGTQLELNRVSLVGAVGWATLVATSDTTVTLRDLSIDATRPLARPFMGVSLGRGIDVQGGASLTVERALIAACHDVGLVAWGGGTTVTTSDVVVRDVGADMTSGFGGRALSALAGAAVVVHGARFVRTREVALSAFGDGTTIDADGLTVTDTAESACEPDACLGVSTGIGIGSYDRAAVRVNGFTVLRSALAGVQVATGAALDLSSGEVAFGPIGANVQVPGLDIARLSDRVAYHDNDRNLDSSSLPVPDASATIPGTAGP